MSESKNRVDDNQFKKQWIDESSSIFYALVYVGNSNQGKYNTTIKTLHQQQSFGNNQFPEIIVEAGEILSNHTRENNKSKLIKRNSAQPNTNIDKKEKSENNFIF